MTQGIVEQTWLELDEFVEAFELAWRANVIPDIADFLPSVEHPRFRETLLELVRVDLELRWQHGRAKSLDEYRRGFPDLFDDADALGQIAFEEFRARRQIGESVTADEYALRYGVVTDTWPVVSDDQHGAPASDRIPNGLDDSLARRAGIEETSHPFPEIGSELLSFHLQSELGRGAFSRVYLARQGDLANRLVVLKVSAESFAESDKLAQLQHANIVPIYSVHRAGPLSAVCMPYFGAATLADVVREVHGLDSLPPSGRVIVETLTACGQRTEIAAHTHSTERRERGSEPAPIVSYDGALKTLSGLSYVEAVLWIGAKLADGLNHAHERGILHRDLKPANVLLADDGRPMLLDFNLSADLKRSVGVREMLVGGTLPYMAPEQIYAFQQRIHGGDARSDLYSLGVILFELLAGRSPFPTRRGSLESLLSQMLHDRQHSRPRLRLLNPAATPAVEAIIRRCLEPDPAQRYQTAAQLHEDLERHLKQLPLRHTREPSLRERAQKWTRRHSWLTAVMSAALIVGGVSLAVVTHRERKRLAEVQAEIASLIKAGRQALDNDEAEVAQGRFLAAWMKVQAEPALIDHQPGVAGWLDHSRRAAIERQLKWHVPPREYDERRDEALLLSLLLDRGPQPQLQAAREAIHAALGLTIPGDPGWTREREQLMLLEADLIALESGAELALASLDATKEFSSRAFYERRAILLNQMSRNVEAEQAHRQAEQHPHDRNEDGLFNGMSRMRGQEFEIALQDFEQLVASQPESFNARLFQAICLLHLNRPAEAKVGLTSCIAQRPHFLWTYFFRSQANSAIGDRKAADLDLQRILEMKPSPALRRATLAQMDLSRAPLPPSHPQNSSDAD